VLSAEWQVRLDDEVPAALMLVPRAPAATAPMKSAKADCVPL